MKKWILLIFVCFALVTAAPAHAWFDNYGGEANAEAEGGEASAEAYAEGGEAYAEGGTGIGVGIGVGKVTNKNMNRNVNENLNFNLQGQKQSQGQGQGQDQGQTQSVTITNPRDHVSVVGPYRAPALMNPSSSKGFHNNVWFGITEISMDEAEALEMGAGFLWGTKTTKHFLKKYAPTDDIKRGGGEFIGVITFRGNYGTKGYEIEARVLKLAMKHGGTSFQVVKRGYEIASKSWSIGFGTSGQAGGLKEDRSLHGGGSAGSGTNYGTAKIKARLYMTIAVFR